MTFFDEFPFVDTGTLLTEKEVHITDLATTTYPYYSWLNLRRFYVDKL